MDDTILLLRASIFLIFSAAARIISRIFRTCCSGGSARWDCDGTAAFPGGSLPEDTLNKAVFQLAFGVYLALEKLYQKQSNLHG
jgi:hypothetical protein